MQLYTSYKKFGSSIDPNFGSSDGLSSVHGVLRKKSLKTYNPDGTAFANVLYSLIYVTCY